MQAQLTVRVPDALDKEISDLAKSFHLKRSDIVRMALEKFVAGLRAEEEKRPYDKVKDLIGSVSSGIPDLGTAHRAHLLRKLKKGE